MILPSSGALPMNAKDLLEMTPAIRIVLIVACSILSGCQMMEYDRNAVVSPPKEEPKTEYPAWARAAGVVAPVPHQF